MFRFFPIIIINIKMALLGSKVLMVGGNGFVGNYLASKFVQQKALVTVLCRQRKGIKHNYPENKEMDWVLGDILEPTKLVNRINEADVIVHTVGALFDTSITKSENPGGPGTYEQLNRDSLASVINHSSNRKKIIYMSSNQEFPFIPRYLSTKHEAEKLLLESQHEGYILRPGFIYNWQHRKWSIPIKYQVELWLKMFPYIRNWTNPGSLTRQYLDQLKMGPTTSLQELGNAVLEIAKNGSKQKIIEGESITSTGLAFVSKQ